MYLIFNNFFKIIDKKAGRKYAEILSCVPYDDGIMSIFPPL